MGKQKNKIFLLTVFALLCIGSAFALLKTGVFGNEKNFLATDNSVRYDIVADLDGGKFEPGSKPEFVKMDNGKWLYKYKPSMLPTKLPKPVKDGFEFAGWVVDNSETPKPEYSIPAWNKENINLRAEWKVLKAVLLPGPEFNSKVEAIPGFKDVTEIHFIKGMPNSNGIDLSEAQNGSIRGHISGNILTIACINQIFANPDCSKMFYGFGRTLWGTNKVLNKIEFSNFDTSHVIDMGYMFYDCSSLISLDVGNFDTSKVTDMEYMFCGCEKLINIGVGNFDTSQVTDMKSMFNSCSSLVSLDVGNFDTSQVTNMRYMFYACRKLTALDLNNFNTSQVVDMNHMFYMCSALSNLDLSNWNVTNVTNMSWMFSECSKLNQLNLSGFTPTKVENMNSMFNACTKLSGEITVSGLEGVTYSGMFTRCSSDSNAEFWVKWTSLKAKEVAKQMVNTKREGIDHVYLWEPESILISGSKFNELFGVGSNINSNPNAMQMLHVTEINFLKEPLKDGGIDVSAKQDGSIKAYIEGSSLNIRCEGKIIANSDCTKLFADMSQIEKLNLENFDSSKVTNMSYIFKDFHNISKQDLTKLDTSNVTNMQGMFKGSTQLIPNTGNEPPIKETINVSTFDTSKVINMREMFSECSALANIDLNSFNLSKVTNVSEMFVGSWNLTEIRGLQKIFDSKITLMNNIFIGCSKLNGEITIKSESLEGLNIEQMFLGCSSDASAEFWVKYISPETKNVAKNMVATKREGIDHVYLWEPSSELLNGQTFNSKIKSISNFSNVTQIKFVKAAPNPAGIDLSEAQDGSIRGLISGNVLTVACSGEIYANVDSYKLFHGCRNVTSIAFDNFNTSKVVNFAWLFNGCSKLSSIDLSKFDTSNVEDMSVMFGWCKALKTIDLSSFDASKVNSIAQMFTYCENLESINLTQFNSENITNAADAFSHCLELITINAPQLSLNKCTNFARTFNRCSSLTSIKLKRPLRLSNVQYALNMFSGCEKLSGELTVAGDVDTYSEMFQGCASDTNAEFWVKYVSPETKAVAKKMVATKREDVDHVYLWEEPATLLLGSQFNEKVKSMPGFSNVTEIKFVKASPNPDGVDLSEWQDGSIMGYISGNVLTIACSEKIFANLDCNGMFAGFNRLISISFDNFDTSKVINMEDMFIACHNLTSLDVSKWDTSNVTNMSQMFRTCTYVSSLAVGNWDTSKVTDMSHMFRDCGKLTTIDVSSWNTSQVISMRCMFNQCINLVSLDAHNWDTSKVTDMSWMFTLCDHLQTVNVDGWDTSKVTDMSHMFRNCKKLSTLDVSGWNTSEVNNMGEMFSNCERLSRLNVSGWNTSKVTDMFEMFSSCVNLSELDTSNWDISKVANTTGMFHQCFWLSGQITVSSLNILEYRGMFSRCSERSGTKFIVKYISPETKNLAQKLVNTADYDSHVYLWEDTNMLVDTKKSESYFRLYRQTGLYNKANMLSKHNFIHNTNVDALQPNKPPKSSTIPKPVKLTLINGPSAQYPKQIMEIKNNKIPNLNAPDLNPKYAGQFGGYFYDKNCTIPVKPNDVVTQDIELYAKW